MIAAHDLRMNLGGEDLLAKRARSEEVVDSPSYISGARVREVAPPRIVSVALGEDPERVDEARIQEILKAFALLLGEPLLAAVRFRIREVELRVRDIQVAAEDHRFFLLQLLAVCEECGIPVLVPQRQSAQVVF